MICWMPMSGMVMTMRFQNSSNCTKLNRMGSAHGDEAAEVGNVIEQEDQDTPGGGKFDIEQRPGPRRRENRPAH